MSRTIEKLDKKIEEDVTRILELFHNVSTLECNTDLRCMLKKAKMIVELNKRLDELLFQLAFVYNTVVNSGDSVMRGMIEDIVDMMAQYGVITMTRWEMAVEKTVNYRKRMDRECRGNETRKA
ncbi:hypothetical protein PFV2_gp11 [Pyrobaculum filamentous virus 2]|uniref:Uncharacterized protein n=2 Tax=Alphatristromavirus TaxID=2022739 RepID=A0A140F3J7_PFV1|nr:hypothetical protein A0E62_gp11 [Pyrobaculum filamentous virus 1]YP_010771962.1 hypothetical protein QIT34_gp11 [Pyrobaculum filamentous virus 2]AML61157.1 hypothetical protein [Pyrobaculum filamentous virus 1]QJF12384.1 hypothetical protein PFV2_gp11 [Pyrobaculum filamentous virus 2]